MIPFIQTKVVVNKSDGERVVNGNCYPTAIACLLRIPPTDVPNIENLWDVSVSFAYEVMDKWLHHQGLKMNYAAYEFGVFHWCSERLNNSNVKEYVEGLTEDQVNQLRIDLKDKYYLVSGKSPRGVTHVCIYKAGEMVHDPHPSGEGLVTEEIFECLEKIDS